MIRSRLGGTSPGKCGRGGGKCVGGGVGGEGKRVCVWRGKRCFGSWDGMGVFVQRGMGFYCYGCKTGFWQKCRIRELVKRWNGR